MVMVMKGQAWRWLWICLRDTPVIVEYKLILITMFNTYKYVSMSSYVPHHIIHWCISCIPSSTHSKSGPRSYVTHISNPQPQISVVHHSPDTPALLITLHLAAASNHAATSSHSSIRLPSLLSRPSPPPSRLHQRSHPLLSHSTTTTPNRRNKTHHPPPHLPPRPGLSQIPPRHHKQQSPPRHPHRPLRRLPRRARQSPTRRLHLPDIRLQLVYKHTIGKCSSGSRLHCRSRRRASHEFDEAFEKAQITVQIHTQGFGGRGVGCVEFVEGEGEVDTAWGDAGKGGSVGVDGL